jgi:hypothetical protein
LGIYDESNAERSPWSLATALSEYRNLAFHVDGEHANITGIDAHE